MTFWDEKVKSAKKSPWLFYKYVTFTVGWVDNRWLAPQWTSNKYLLICPLPPSSAWSHPHDLNPSASASCRILMTDIGYWNPRLNRSAEALEREIKKPGSLGIFKVPKRARQNSVPRKVCSTYRWWAMKSWMMPLPHPLLQRTPVPILSARWIKQQFSDLNVHQNLQEDLLKQIYRSAPVVFNSAGLG